MYECCRSAEMQTEVHMGLSAQCKKNLFIFFITLYIDITSLTKIHHLPPSADCTYLISSMQLMSYWWVPLALQGNGMKLGGYCWWAMRCTASCPHGGCTPPSPRRRRRRRWMGARISWRSLMLTRKTRTKISWQVCIILISWCSAYNHKHRVKRKNCWCVKGARLVMDFGGGGGGGGGGGMKTRLVIAL